MLRVVVTMVLLACSSGFAQTIFDDDWDKTHPPKKTTPDTPPAPQPQPKPARHRPGMTQGDNPTQTPAPTPVPEKPAVEPAVTPPPAPAPAAVIARLPPPADAVLAAGKKAVMEVYGGDITAAKTPIQKIELSRNLLQLAAQEVDIASRYALLLKAIELAVDASDCAQAFAVIDEMDRSFNVDAVAMRSDALAKVLQTAKVAQKRELANCAGTLVQTAIAADRYDIASSAANTELTLARATGEHPLVTEAQADGALAKDSEKAFAAFKSASTVLQSKPQDPDSNLTVGKFLCFVKHDWTAGLPNLARGKDPALKVLAEKEANGANSDESMVALADGWWDLAERDSTSDKKAMQARATKWYEEALPLLSGLKRAKVEQRLAIFVVIKPATEAPTPTETSSEIAAAIARHDLAEGMTFQQARQSARKPYQLLSQSADHRTKTYQWVIKGVVGHHKEREGGVRSAYHDVADWGIKGYVMATFVDDKLTTFERAKAK